MEKRITSLIEKLVGYREEVLNRYLSELDLYDPKNGSTAACDRAGLLYDLDKHITNLESEIKRIEYLARFSTSVTMAGVEVYNA